MGKKMGEGKTTTACICKNKKGEKDFVLDLVKIVIQVHSVYYISRIVRDHASPHLMLYTYSIWLVHS
jgi:hypothetical protein